MIRNVKNINQLYKIMYGCILLLGFLLSAQYSFAAQPDGLVHKNDQVYLMLASADSTDGALDDLLSILGKETEIATKTKMNIDFVPGMVTVLHGKDLLAQGVRTVFEAMKLVPGVDINIAGDGQTQLIFRGLGKVFGSGKVKVLVNGVPFNNSFTAQTSLNAIVIEQVNRIEVIRGPGSAIYGEYAFAGVIDVITKNADSEFFTRFGSLNSKMAGGIYSYKNDENDLAVSLNISTSEYDPDNVIAGADLPIVAPISNAPGPVNDNEEHLSAIFKIDYKGVSFIGEKIVREFGNYFGANNALPTADTETVRKVDLQTFEINAPIRITETLSSEFKIGWENFVFNAEDQQLFPAGFFGSFPDGVFATPHYEEDKYYADYELRLQNVKDHDIIMGVDYAQIKQSNTSLTRNFTNNPASFPPFTQIPETTFTTTGNFLKPANERTVMGVFVQDQWTITDKFNITAGIRFDDYDDVGSSTTPRVAAVYRLSDYQTVKFQYAEAFRPPTFIELYSQNPIVNGNENLKAETIENIEIGYVYNDGVTIGRLTIYGANMKDLIGNGNNSPVIFENIGKARLQGVELELIRQLGSNFKFDSNLTVTDVDNKVNKTEFANIANLLINLGLIYQPVNDFSFNVQYRYTGEKEREVTDTRNKLDSFNTVDFTASFFNLVEDNLTLRFGVRNLLDEELLSPAPENTYVDDYPQPGREYWLSLAYKL